MWHQAVRSDQLDKPGKISEQMLDYLNNADLCVAVLTGRNPNVFYELAIAQCAQTPVILLLEKPEEPPFDVYDQRAVFYDLRIRAFNERMYINQVIRHVEEFEKTGPAPPPVTIEPIKDGSNFRFLEKSMNYGGKQEWIRLLQNTDEVFDLMGITLRSWSRSDDLGHLLTKKASDGCKVRILLMHKDNPAFSHLINQSRKEFSHEVIGDEAEQVFRYFSRVAADAPDVEVRQIAVGCPHYQLTRTDQVVNFITYLYSAGSGSSPLWQYDRSSSLYMTMTQEFESLWSVSEPGQ